MFCSITCGFYILLQGFGADPVDVAAHLKIVGESLSIIGMRLQEHRVSILTQMEWTYCVVCPQEIDKDSLAHTPVWHSDLHHMPLIKAMTGI